MKQIAALVLTLLLMTSSMPVRLRYTLLMNSDDKKESFKVGDIPEKFKDQPDVLGSWTHLEYSRTCAFGKKDNGLFVIISSGKDGMALTPSWKESKLLVDGKTYDVPQFGIRFL